MNDTKLQIMARREEWDLGISLYARSKTPDGYFFAQPLVMTSYKPNSFTEPFIKLGIEDAQKLMDELWQCGLRPSEGTGSAGSLAATERHLADMRSIVVKTLGVTF